MKSKILYISLFTVLFFAVIFICTLYANNFHLANPDLSKYPVRGVDVSSYQGNINWETIASQNITFAYIKATEGSSHQDSFYHQNIENAKSAGIAVGAYHFFSYDSSGKTQAENFIATVGTGEGMLPPVIDVEFYNDYSTSPADKTEAVAILSEMISELESYYGISPIIYATPRSYYLYIKDNFQNCGLWIRNTVTYPVFLDRDWVFWQYSGMGNLNGHSHASNYIDLNVFCGSFEEFYSRFQ